jgi:PAS domain S-box-containing protein
MWSSLMKLHIPNSEAIGKLPWFIRFLFGCCMACGAVALTSAIVPLRHFPLILAFPTVVLSAWYLGMWGAAGCALMDVALVDAFLTRAQFRFSTGNAAQELRLFIFLVITLSLGWSIRRLAQQKADFASLELKARLERAEAERKLAEEHAQASEQLRYRDDVLQIALNASGMGLWVWDIEKEIVHRSDEVFRIVGCEPGGIAPDARAWLEFVHPDDVPALDEAFAKVRAEGAEYHMQYRVRRRDGSIRWIESQGRVQRNADGKIARIMGVMADITQRKQADEALLRAEKLAVAGRLAASVAHEINNPLEAVANMLYLITISETREQAQLQASNALDELMRVSLVAQSTLKFHRETGTPRSTMLSEVLDSVLTMFRGRLRTGGITVDVDSQREFPISCMPSEMQQILANFVANSIEAIQNNGRIAIRLRPSRDWRNGGLPGMRVTITDNGAGMDRATLKHVFEPFFTTKPETGTGLGLWVVAELVERHKGRVHVRTSQKPGASGTVFSIFLPNGDIATDGDGLRSVEAAVAVKTQHETPDLVAQSQDESALAT